MNKTSIEWCDYTWNPVVGCKHGCPYCYAKRLNDRFKFIEEWNKPQFFENRLLEPHRLRKPATIFAGSMCDLFGDWIEDWIIKCILREMAELPRHTFMFLTKNPRRYQTVVESQYCDLKNIMLGATITDTGDDYQREYIPTYMNWLAEKYGLRTFLSIEPIMSDFSHVVIPEGIELVIVGAMTGPKVINTPAEWINSVRHHNIFYKNSVKKDGVIL